MATTIVIFGASGDLTSRKLIPSLYQLHRKKRLPPETRIIGSSRTKFTHEAWRASLGETTKKFTGKDFDEALWTEFAAKIFYHAGDLNNDADMAKLKSTIEEIEGGQAVSRIYYLATAPQFYSETIERLGKTGLADESKGTRRVVIEKPFGTDFNSAKALNEEVHRVYKEKKVYRIDQKIRALETITFGTTELLAIYAAFSAMTGEAGAR